MSNPFRALGRTPDSLEIAVFFALLLALMGWFSLRAYRVDDGRIVSGQASATSGDEPHYLLVVNSLLMDGDLALGDDYQRAYRGGLEAGARFSGRTMTHHTIVVDPETGEHAQWLELFDWQKYFRCWPRPGCRESARYDDRIPGLERAVERSAHPIGFPLVAAAALAPTRPAPEQVEGRFALFMAFSVWLGTVLTFASVRAIGLSTGPALTAAALLGLASPWLGYGRSFYSEPIAGVALILAFWAIVKRRVSVAALAVAAAAIIKPMFALVALAWLAVEAGRRNWRDAWVFSAWVALCGGALFSFNYWMAGTPLIFGAGPLRGLNTGYQLLGTLLHPYYGVLRFAPWTLLALFGLIGWRRYRAASNPDPLLWIAAPMLPLLVLMCLYGALGGNCYGPRYWVPLLPWMAVAATAACTRSGRTARWCLAGLAFFGAAVAIPGALLYPDLWDRTADVGMNVWLRSVLR